MCICLCVHVTLCIYMCMCASVCMCLFKRERECECNCVSFFPVSWCLCMYICICVYYVYAVCYYVCVYVCICVYLYMCMCVSVFGNLHVLAWQSANVLVNSHSKSLLCFLFQRHAHIHKYANIHLCTHTYIYAYSHIHTWITACCRRVSPFWVLEIGGSIMWNTMQSFGRTVVLGKDILLLFDIHRGPLKYSLLKMTSLRP